MRIIVLGLGQVGLPTALFMEQSGFEVIGYDVSRKAVDQAKARKLNATIDWQDIPSSDVYVICVSTLLKDNKPDLTAIYDIAKKISGNAKAEGLISIESTLPAGVCRKLHDKFLKKQHLVHVPHRYWAGDSINHGVKQTRVIGGVDEESLKRGISFYRDTLSIPLHIAPSIEVAEISKIAENSYRYVQIAFAQELRQMCENAGVDFKDLRQASNTKWNIDIHDALNGIGGHCLPKDIRYLAGMNNYHPLIDSAIHSNAVYVKWRKKH